MGNGSERSFGHSATPVSTDDVVRVVSRALSERAARLHRPPGSAGPSCMGRCGRERPGPDPAWRSECAVAHRHGSPPSLPLRGALRLPPPLRRLLAGVVGVFVLAAVISGGAVAAALAEGSHRRRGHAVDLVDATVTAAPVVPCRSALPGVALVCRDVTARPQERAGKGPVDHPGYHGES